ncbi:hypothetical protein Tco_1245413, partial [Tanacetum coccineum]
RLKMAREVAELTDEANFAQKQAEAWLKVNSLGTFIIGLSAEVPGNCPFSVSIALGTNTASISVEVTSDFKTNIFTRYNVGLNLL